jgi:hypothetical protein
MHNSTIKIGNVYYITYKYAWPYTRFLYYKYYYVYILVVSYISVL